MTDRRLDPKDAAVSTTEQRTAWLKEWAAAHPNASVHRARDSVPAAAVQARLKMLVNEPRNLGVRHLEITDDGYRVEMVWTGGADRT